MRSRSVRAAVTAAVGLLVAAPGAWANTGGRIGNGLKSEAINFAKPVWVAAVVVIGLALIPKRDHTAWWIFGVCAFISFAVIYTNGAVTHMLQGVARDIFG